MTHHHKYICHERGFTLIELMIVITTIGVLAAIAVPRFTIYMLEGRVSAAKPYLMAIAAKERAYSQQYGSYYGTQQEIDIQTKLGVNVAEVGDFCFTVVCPDSTKCGTNTSGSYSASGAASDADIDFEVWAILRRSATGDIGACVPNADANAGKVKVAPTQWVKADDGVSPGREGLFAVLRYPAPVDGLSTDETQFWQSGISVRSTLRP